MPGLLGQMVFSVRSVFKTLSIKSHWYDFFFFFFEHTLCPKERNGWEKHLLRIKTRIIISDENPSSIADNVTSTSLARNCAVLIVSYKEVPIQDSTFQISKLWQILPVSSLLLGHMIQQQSVCWSARVGLTQRFSVL